MSEIILIEKLSKNIIEIIFMLRIESQSYGPNKANIQEVTKMEHLSVVEIIPSSNTYRSFIINYLCY